jgi:hypothetical protein
MTVRVTGMRARSAASLCLLLAVLIAGCGPASAAPRSRPERVSGGPTGTYVVPAGIHKIKHVIVIEQENRSFDSYFGTYPGAIGIPMKHGVPAICDDSGDFGHPFRSCRSPRPAPGIGGRIAADAGPWFTSSV